MPRAFRPTAFASLAVLAALLCAPRPSRAQGPKNGTVYVTFWRGDLRIIATRSNTRVRIVDITTGAPLLASRYTANLSGNPFVLTSIGDSFEGTGTGTLRVRIESSTDSGPVEDKPIIVWTGSLETGLKHPPGPPSVTNAWMSYLPALAAGSVENGTEIGRDLWGFASREMYIFARKGAEPGWVWVEDLRTNVDPDSDDSVILYPSSPQKVLDDGFMEVYHLDNFEDDTVRVTSNHDVSVLVGAGSTTAVDWTATPASFGPGEDFRELGTLFYTFVSRDLTIFPTQDDTTVTITDLSDGDDSTTFTLAQGASGGAAYDVFTADLLARNGTMLVPRAAAPAVAVTTLGAAGPFENDFVKVTADKPVLLYVGPKSADTQEYADVAYSVRTGPARWLTYGYAQNGGAEDFQLFVQSAATSVQITSLTYTLGFGSQSHHDWSMPTPTAWQGGNPTTGDYFWSSGAWAGELLRIESDGPLTVMDGDYDGPNFGCFIPFIADSGLLNPIADAGNDAGVCSLEVTLDGSRSFDADTTPGAFLPTWTWDIDASVDADSDGDPTNDADLSGAVVAWTFPAPGSYPVTLTYTDDDGQRDTDVILVDVAGDPAPPDLTCPPRIDAVTDSPDGATVPVLAAAVDDCDLSPTVTNDRTPGGADASGFYPCGETAVRFDASDAAGNAASACITVVAVTPAGPPPRVDAPIKVVKTLPVDMTWSLTMPVGPLARIGRLFAAGSKDVAPAGRSVAGELPVLQTTLLEANGIAGRPDAVYYQLVLVSCDDLLEGPY